MTLKFEGGDGMGECTGIKKMILSITLDLEVFVKKDSSLFSIADSLAFDVKSKNDRDVFPVGFVSNMSDISIKEGEE